MVTAAGGKHSKAGRQPLWHSESQSEADRAERPSRPVGVSLELSVSWVATGPLHLAVVSY